jgi:sugar lactone lactonase YvrE
VGTNTLRLVNQATGQPTTVGLIGLDGARDMASDPRAGSLRLWASSTDQGGNLYLIDPSGGGTTLVGHMNTASNMRTLAFDVTSGQLYGTTYAKELYRIDPATAAVTLVGAVSGIAANADFDSLACDAQGVIYTTTLGFPSQLYTINPTTAVATLKASTNRNGFFSDIAFRPEDGVLFGITNGEFGQLYTINTTTGAVTAMGGSPNYDGTGLAFLTPEPGAAGVVGIVAGVGLLRRRRTQGEAARRE